MLGKVVHLLSDRGFGFVRPVESEHDRTTGHFLHASQCCEGLDFATLTVGTIVEFESARTDRGLQAVRIRKPTEG